MGDAEDRSFRDLAGRGQDTLQLRRTDALSRNLDGVVRPAENVVEAVFAPHGKVAMHPDPRNRIPIALEIALIGLPQPLGQADRGVPQDTPPDLPAGAS